MNLEPELTGVGEKSKRDRQKSCTTIRRQVMDNYKIEVSVELYKGDLREEGNNFTHKEARYLQTVLYKLLGTWTHFNRLKEINPNE